MVSGGSGNGLARTSQLFFLSTVLRYVNRFIWIYYIRYIILYLFWQIVNNIIIMFIMKFLCIIQLYFTAQNSSWLSTIPRKTRPVQWLCMTLHTLHYHPHPQVEWSRTRSLVGPLSSPGPWMDGGSQGIYQLNAQWEEHSLGNQPPHPDRLYWGTSSSVVSGPGTDGRTNGRWDGTRDTVIKELWSDCA